MIIRRLIILILALLSIPASAEMVTRTRTAVDTVAAMQKIKDKIYELNQPFMIEITNKENKLKEMQKGLEFLETKKRDLRDLSLFVEPKVKDEARAARIYSYLITELTNLPNDSIYKYANQKAFHKACNDKNWRNKLAELRKKEIDKVLKDAAKRKFESGLVKSCFWYKLSLMNEELDKKEKEFQKEQKKRDGLKSRLRQVPSSFTAELWLKEMPYRDVPTKVITEIRERNGEDDLSFEEALKKYYSNGSFHSCFAEGRLVAEGKFDGLIKDTVGIFPVGSSGIMEDTGSYWCYSKLILMSEKGTVPNIIIQAPEEMGEYGFYISRGETDSYSGYSVEKYNGEWEDGEPRKDGIKLMFHPEGSTITCVYTWHIKNNQWINQAPLDIEYLSFDDCLNRMKKFGHKPEIKIFKSRCWDEYGFGSEEEDISTMRIMVVTEDKIGLNGKKFFIKAQSKDNNGRYEDLPAFEIGSSDKFHSIEVISNGWEKGYDMLCIRYEKELFDRQHLVEYYRYELQEPGCDYINGKRIRSDGFWIKRAQGKYDTLTE